MKKFLWSALAIMMVSALSIGFTSCGDDDDPDEVSVGTSMANFVKDGGSQVVNIMSNTNWTVSGAQSWVQVSPMTGSHNGMISINVGKNTGAFRSCTLIIQAGSASASISISQEGDDVIDDLATRASGIYVGKLTSGGEIVDDAYKIIITRLNSTSVEVDAAFFGNPVNFNVSESQGQLLLTNTNYPDITMYITGNTLNCSFVNAAQTMTSFIGTKN